MNEMTEPEKFALPAVKTDLAALFASPEKVTGLLDGIAKEVRSFTSDTSTTKGRADIRSRAAKVARTKTAFDAAGKDLNQDHQAAIDAVNAERKKGKEFLQNLQDETRKPLTDWETAEDDRKGKLAVRLAAINVGSLTAVSASAEIAERIAGLESVEIDDSWAESQEEAEFAKDSTLAQLRMMLESAQKSEADARELEELRLEVAKRREAEAKAEQERLEKEAAEREKREAAEREEREKQAEIDRKAEAAKRAADQKSAELRAAQDAKHKAELEAARREAALKEKAREKAAQHRRDLKEAKAREEAAVEAERQRQADERRAQIEKEDRLAADYEHQAKVLTRIIDAITDLPDHSTFLATLRNSTT